MASLEQIRDAGKATIDTNIDALHVYDTVPDATNLPALIFMPSTANFDVVFGRGTDTWNFDLYVLAPYADASLGQDALDAFVTGAGDQSIRQCIFQNRTLGLPNTNAHIFAMDNYGARFESAGIDHIGAVLHMVVHTSGTA